MDSPEDMPGLCAGACAVSCLVRQRLFRFPPKRHVLKDDLFPPLRKFVEPAPRQTRNRKEADRPGMGHAPTPPNQPNRNPVRVAPQRQKRHRTSYDTGRTRGSYYDTPPCVPCSMFQHGKVSALFRKTVDSAPPRGIIGVKSCKFCIFYVEKLRKTLFRQFMSNE